MRSILLLVVLVTISLATSAQGTLRGTITDKKTGETLIGATVVLVGTSTGAITDFDGKYSISLPAGIHTISMSFISYETLTFNDVKIVDGEVTVLNSIMGEAQLVLGEVTVIAKSNKRNEASMMLMQRKSSKIMDGIGAQQMAKLGDSNAAAALKRVTGVSVQGGKYVYVRGLGDRYTKTTLNGAEIPALDPQRNTVQMDMFPSNVIENIVVSKTYSPDMPGESTGGHVDVITRDFPDKFNLQASATFKYNTQSSLNKDFISYTPSKTDFLGYDGGVRDVPAVAQATLNDMSSRKARTVDLVYYSHAELGDFTKSFSTEVAPKQQTSFLDQSYKFSLGDQIAVGGDQAIGYNLSASYSNSFDYFDNGVLGKYADSELDALKTATIRSGSVKNKIALLGNLNYKISSNHKIGLRFLRNQAGSRIASYRDGYDNSDSRNYQERNLNYQGRQFSSLQFHGKHVLTGLNNSTISWISSYTDMMQSEPDNRFFLNNYKVLDDNTVSYTIQPNKAPSRLYRGITEVNSDSKVDFEMPFKLFGKGAKLKVGSAYLYKKRVGSQKEFSMNIAETGLNYNGNFEVDGNWSAYLAENAISADKRDGYSYNYVISDSEKGGYEANSTVISGYALVDGQIGDRLKAMIGARFESYHVFVANNVPSNESDYVSNDNTVHSILPSLNLTYALIEEKMNLRLAVSQTTARPVFREIAPQSFYDYLAGMRFTGNTELNPTTVINADMRWEYFFKHGEMVALSGFYKRFDSPIERRMDNGTSNLEVLYFNAETSNLFGVEAELRKKLDFIGLPNFTLGANVTLVKSAVKLQDEEKIFRPNVKERPMVGQAPFLINTYLGYSNTDLDLDVNIGYNTEGDKMFLITQQATPYIFEKQRHLINLSVSKGIKENWSLRFGINNLLNTPYEAAYMNDDIEATYLKYTEGTSYSFSLKYTIR